MNRFYINDEYGYQNYEYLDELLNYALEKLNINNVTFSIILVDDNYIQNINKQYRGIDKVTDVISFAFNDNAKFKNLVNVLGDIYISIPQMIKQARDYEHSEKRELGFLSIHGLLHLLGYDHIKKEDEVVMFNLQKEILNEKKF